MRKPSNNEIATTDSVEELSELLDRSNGWVVVEETSGSPDKLQGLKDKYGDFFEYIHLLNSTQEEEIIRLYDPDRKRTFDLLMGDIQWRALNQEEFVSNTSVFLTKGFTVIGVREKYAHFCALALNNFFRGLTQCFIVKEEDYEATTKKIN
jgi:hypothetical protein